MARGDIFYEGWIEYLPTEKRQGNKQVVHVAVRWGQEDAETKLKEFVASQTARGYPPARSWVEEKTVETDFEIPPLSAPATATPPAAMSRYIEERRPVAALPVDVFGHGLSNQLGDRSPHPLRQSLQAPVDLVLDMQ
jgi:hypothetical protein